MRQQRARALGALFAVITSVWFSACGSDDEDPPPPSFTPHTGGRQSFGGRPATGGRETTGGVVEAGAAGRVEAGGAPSSSGGAPPSGGGTIGQAGEVAFGGEKALEPFETPPLCPDSDAWDEGVRIDELSTGEDDLIGGVTPDEGTLVWLSGEAVMYADRADASEPFGEPQTPEDTDFVQGTISPDGLHLVGTRFGNFSFAEVVRESRDEPFSGEPDDSAFTDLNSTVAAIPVAKSVGDPLLVGDDWFVFSYYLQPPDMSPTIRQGVGPLWSFGVPIGGAMLLALGDERRIATGFGADLRTLFYWDEVEGIQQQAQRADAGSDFDRYQSLGDRRGAVSNEACDRLYYSAPGPDGDLDLFVASLR
ncbi:MAG: hypothetical protein M3020_01980 [Myxococcota bacterium]|nr:hypothetical protein [Myxococcota bacterium]